MLKLHLFALYADVKELVEGLTLNGFVSLFGLNGDKIQNASFIINFMVGLIGLEPMTLRLSSACSNQLSYRPIFS